PESLHEALGLQLVDQVDHDSSIDLKLHAELLLSHRGALGDESQNADLTSSQAELPEHGVGQAVGSLGGTVEKEWHPLPHRRGKVRGDVICHADYRYARVS